MSWVRCPNCHALLGDKYLPFMSDLAKTLDSTQDKYKALTKEDVDNRKLFEKYKVNKLCCRVHLFTGINRDLIEHQIRFDQLFSSDKK